MSDEEVINAPIITVNAHVIYGIKRINDVEVILTNDDTNESFTGVTDSNGDCTIQIIGSTNSEDETGSLEGLLRDYLVEVGCEHYSTNTNVFTPTSKDNQLILYLVKLDDCQNQILTRKNCKYFHHDPYMTPNNFDLYYDPSKIPVNIIQDPPHELLLRLQKTLPLTDILHLNLEKEEAQYSNVVNLNTTVKLKFNTRDVLIYDSPLTITGMWKGYDESESICNKTYTVHYLYDTTIALEGVTVKLVNKDYPLIYYEGVTDKYGVCSLNIPYGTYIQQFLTSEYTLPETIITINQEEEDTEVILGSSAEDSTMDFYMNGILSTTHATDNVGMLSTDGNIEYEQGELRINGANELSEEQLLNVLLHTEEDYTEDFTEFTVKIVDINKGVGGAVYTNGALTSTLMESDVGILTYDDTYIEYTDGYLIIFTGGQIVDEVVLNGANGFTAETITLPIFESGTNNKIFYILDYNMINCEVVIEDMEHIGLNTNEVVLL